MNKGFIGVSTLLALVIIVLPLVVLISSYVIVQGNRQYILDTPGEVTTALADEPRTVIVFGSGLHRDGTPRPVLTARLDAAMELYDAGVVDRFIVSGSTEDGYNEPRAMHAYLITKGVPAESVTQDDAGDRTLATCTNARNIHGIDEAVLVTQLSHIARAIHLCRSQDIAAYGYVAQPAGSQAAQYFQQVRETGGNVRAVLDVISNEREELEH